MMWNRTKIILEAVKIEHTVFALPFAYLGLVLAEGGWPRWPVFFWVTLAMAGLRTSGMLFNRMIDAELDGKNPRTKQRAIPAGKLSYRSAWMGVVVSSGLFFLAALNLNRLCLVLSWIPYLAAVAYPFLKRWTVLCHFGVGLVLAGAPLGGWLASRGAWEGAPILVSAAVLFWVAGFDVIYSLQDIEFDQKHKLCSIPVRMGAKKAVYVAAFFHVLTAACLIAFGFERHLGIIYMLGMLAITAFLIRQHMLILRHGMNKIEEAFFTLNASVSVAMFVFTLADLLVNK